jgi:hypothetical protein
MIVATPYHRPMIALILLAALLFAPAAFAQVQEPPPPGGIDSTTTVPQRDVMDVIARLLNRRVEPELGGTTRTGLQWAILPTFSYNPVYGVALGAMMSGAGQRGSSDARYSQLALSANYSTEGQFQAQARGDLFSTSGKTLSKIDVRYLDTERSTWGLGKIEEGQEEFPMAFILGRLYATIYRRTSGPVFIGLGYHFDQFKKIVDERAAAGETTPFSDYSGGTPEKTIASGFSVNVLGDTRDNLVNASAGYYLSASFRDYMKTVASDDNWQELWVEMRVYPHLPASSRSVLGFWLYAWMTFGHAPYLNLPSNGWDTYGRGARGYLQGRIRGANQIYFESEYRRTLTADGLLGAVGFVNGTITTDPETNIFTRADIGAGVGLRLKFNKHTNTNLTLDFGWGRDDSHGLFLGMTEVF